MTIPVPFYMLCGSLGAGKTTLLMRLLEFWRDQRRKVGVVMNESGEVSIDGPRAGALAQQVLNLAGGCVCCDTKDDLAWGVTQLIHDHRSDLIVLECSGMANPAEVIDAVTDAFVARLVALERVIALLNPAVEPARAYGDPVVAHSVRYADDIILNKRDLAIGPLWEGSRAQILRQNPHARLWETSHARVEVSALLDSPGRPRVVSPAPNVAFQQKPARDVATRAPYHPMVVTLRLPGALDRVKFLEWMRRLPTGLERAKGYFRFTGDPSLQEFQYAPPGVNTIAPLHLLDEPPHAIVLIGREYDQAACREALMACLDTRSC